MDVTYLDPDDAMQVDELFAVRQLAHAADHPDHPAPLRDDFLAAVRHPPPSIRVERLVARIDGRVAGGAVLNLTELDNRHLAMAEVQVSPAYRRRGAGRALLDQVRERAHEERRRTLLAAATGPVPGGPPRDEAGNRFLAAMGFTPGLASARRRIDLTTIDPVAEQRLLDECRVHADAYECLSWTGLTPDELADGVTHLVNRLNTDAPTGEVELEATTVDADLLHADEESSLAKGTHLLTTAARHRATGELAAFTRIDVRSAGDHGHVWMTLADPKHRGHRLGTIVKIENHRLARATFPKLRYVQTGNADSNTHMVAINNRLGFVAFEAVTLYQLAL
jgi:GNAT superfamily N-acetyltransferase